MSKGGGQPAQQTTQASLPKGFESAILGTPQPFSLKNPLYMGDGGSRFFPPGFGGGAQGPQEDYFKGTLPEAQDLFMQGLLAPAPTQGETTQQALAQQQALAGQIQSDFLPQISGIFGSLGDQSGAIADMATQDMRDAFARQVTPSIQQGAIQAGQLGSSRQGIAEGLANAELEKDIAGTRAQILQQGASKQLAFAPQLLQMLGAPSSLLGQVGAQQDAFAQAGAESQFQNLLRLAQLQQGFIPGASTTTISTPQEQSSINKALSGGLAGFAATGNPWVAGGAALLSLLG